MLHNDVFSQDGNLKLTPYQAIFYYEWLQDPLRNDYNIIMDNTISGDICLKRFMNAIDKLVNEHFIFRHNVKNKDGDLYWVKRDVEIGAVSYYDHNLSDDEIYRIISKPINLEKDLLLAAHLIKLAENKYRIIFVFPHISIDGLSTDEVYIEWANYYNDVNYTKAKNLEQQAKDHCQLSEYFNEILTNNNNKIHDFWRKRLQDVSGVDFTFLKRTHLPQPREFRFVSEEVFSFDTEILNKAKSLKSYKITPYVFGQMVLGILLHKVSGEPNIGITYPIAKMEGKDLAFGAHVNTLIIDYRFNADTTINNLIDSVLSFFKDLKIAKAKYLPINEIARYVGNTSVMEIGFAQTFLRDHLLGLEGVSLDSVNHKFQIDLVNKLLFEQEQHDNRLNYRIRYDDHILDADLVRNFTQMYIKLFEEILEDLMLGNSGKAITEYHLLDNKQYNEIVYEWNDTDKAYPTQKTIQTLFQEQVEKTPDNLALVYQGVALTYNELNERANALSAYLKDKFDIQPDDLVALCLNRTEHMLISILAVLKAGGAYVPMDPSAPAERLAYMISDTKTKVILTNEVNAEKLELLSDSLSTTILSVDNKVLIDNIQLNYSKDNPQNNSLSTNLAYVIYTSGTTGQPKGVMIEHRSLVNLALMQAQVLGLNGENIKPKKCIWYANYVFDAHVSEVFIALVNGHSLHLIDGDVRTDINLLSEYINENQISLGTIPPVLLDKEHLLNLETLIVAGDVTNLEVMDAYIKNNVNVVNAYGPTEATVCSTMHYFKQGDLNTNIGTAIPNMKIYVLDNEMYPVPLGVVGELYIGGAGVARGYLNNPDLTKDKFITNPFQTEYEIEQGINARLYKSGDLVRRLPNGDIEYIGRNDFQIKIRGYRIELGEIESRLSSYPEVQKSAPVVKENNYGTKYIVAYYVADSELDPNSIRAYLEEYLPDYMVPSLYIQMEDFPFTVNGKLDYRALPEPSLTDSKNYVAPTNELEKDLCRIFADVLALDVAEVGIEDDFLRLGGDSISSIQLISRLRQRMNTHISVKDIFKYKTVKALSHYIRQATKDAIQLKTEQGILKGSVNLLPIQKWFFNNVNENLYSQYNHWNQTFMLDVPVLDKDVLYLSLQKLIEQHDAFNLNYEKQKQFYQHSSSNILLEFVHINDLSSREELDLLLNSWQESLDIFDNKLFHIAYLEGYPNGRARIHFVIHHLIVDAVSWRIIKTDLQSIYEYLITNKDRLISEIDVKEILGDKGSSYRQWVDALSEYKNIDSEEEQYWKSITSNVPFNNQLLAKIEADSWNKTELSLNKLQTNSLIRDVHTVYNTQINDILLSALSLSLKKLTGESENYVTIEGHGREDIFSDIDITHTMGWFTTMYPIQLVSKRDYSETIVHTKDMLRLVPNNGIGYGALVGYTEHELPKIGFNYLGQFDENEKGEGNQWVFSQENCGLPISSENKDSNILNINCGVIGGELRFSFTGSLDAEVLSDFANFFKTKLEEIINQLTDRKRTYLTCADVDFIIPKNHLDAIQAKDEIEGVFFANSLQQGFVYHALNQGDIDEAYRTQLLWDYHSSIDEPKLKEAWSLAQKKYPSLRLRFSWEEKLIQIIDKKGKVDWRHIDITHLDEELQTKFVAKLLLEDSAEAYDLAQGNLFRIYFIKRNESYYNCVFNNHHAILDGWSNPILLLYVHETYLKLINGEKVDSTADSSYLKAQNYLQISRDEHQQFWDHYLKNVEDNEDLSSLLKSQKRNIVLSDYGHIQEPLVKELDIVGDRYKQLKNICSSNGVTFNALLQYCWHKQLSVYGAATTTVTGMTVAGRNIPVEGVEQSVGLYINTLPVILQHHSGSVINALKELQSHINDVNSHGEVNLAKLQKGGNRLFNTLFVFENYPMPKDFSVGDKLSLKYKGIKEKQDYPLVLTAYEQATEAKIKLQYAGELFDDSTINQLLEGITILLDQLIENPSVKAEELVYLNSDDYQKIIYKWNSAEKRNASKKTIQAIVEQEAELNPDNIAVVYEDKTLTYKEFNEKSNCLANYLKETYDIHPDDFIALALDRSENIVVAILATLKSGAAYVPMDPGAPDERLEYMIEDTAAKVILTNGIHKERLIALAPNASVIVIDDDIFFEHIQGKYSPNNPETDTKPANLAYVIYTSGTTGQPKGVMVEHQNVVNLFEATDDLYHFSSKDVWTLFHAYTFDFTVWELWGAFFYGGKLVIPTFEQTRDMNMFYDLCTTEGVTVLNQTPNAFYQFIDVTANSLHKIQSLRYIIFGGEALNLEQLKPWYAMYSDTAPYLVNMYGITETTVHVTYKKLIKTDLDRGSLIGVAIPNYQYYVLDNNMRPLPLGTIGELYVGGAGLTRGYLNNPKLTAQRFPVNPFQTETEKQQGINSRIYKSGDLVRLLPDGELEYIGRNDFQVKIRGFRIELGEIETRLSSYSEIRQSVVIVKEHSNETKYLAGYYIAEEELNRDDLHNYMSEHLPSYMVPSVFVHMSDFPLTVNGKLDRKALPEPNFVGGNTYVAPQNEVEEQLCHIYAEVLDVSAVGIEDDFFKLGGDSISSIQLISRLRQRMGININVRDVFTNRTIKALYTNVISKASTDVVKIQSEQGILEGNVGLLPIQKWFFDNVDKGLYPAYNYWNQSFMIKVPALDKALLNVSINKLLNHHDAFKLEYRKAENNSYEQYYQVKEFNLHVDSVNVKDVSEEQRLNEILTSWQDKFDIFSGSLFHVGYLDGYPDGSARIHFATHHLIIDAVSWRIIKNDLQTIYEYLINQHDIDPSLIETADILEQKGSSYRQWVNTIEKYKDLQVDEERTERLFWENSIAGIPYSNSVLSKKEKSLKIDKELSFDKTFTNTLLRGVNHVYGTQVNDILLTALSISLSKFTGLNENHVLLEGHGRENISPDIDVSNTIGWFTSMYPIRFHRAGDDYEETLVEVKDMLKQIPNNGIGYGALMGYTNQELPRISFNYLGQFSSNDNSEWSFSNDNVGIPVSPDNKDNNILNINGGVIEGELRFFIAGTIGEHELAQFALSYHDTLRELVTYLETKDRSYLTVSDIENIISPQYLKQLQAEKEVEAIYLANSLQQGFIYHALSQGNLDNAYRTQLLWDYDCTLDESKLKEAWKLAQDKYPSLRLRFSWQEDLIQIIDKQGAIDWRYFDISDMNDNNQELYITDLLSDDRNEAYDLEKGSLFRIYLLKRSDSHYTCIFNNHHAILDGWSNPLLLSYVHEAYLKLIKGVSVTYNEDVSYLSAQRYLQNNHLNHQQYWVDYLKQLESNEDLNALLKAERKQVNLSEYKYVKDAKEQKLVLKENQYKDLKKICSNYGFTINALLQYCWHKQLNIYGATDTTVVGMTVAGRNIPIEGIEESVGLYINTLPVVMQHTDESIVEAIAKLQNSINEVNNRSDVNLSKLHKGGNRLFNTLFIFENYPAPEDNDADENLSFKFRGVTEKQDYPLVVTAYEQQQEIVFKLQYAGELFDDHTIKSLLDRISLLLNQLLTNQAIRTSELAYLSKTEYHTVIEQWNSTIKEYPSTKTMKALFEEQVEKTPDNIAVRYKNTSLTYRELNERSNILAAFLKANYNIQPDDLIGLCLDRSENIVVAVLAVIKTGGAYVPMDSGAPDDRLAYMITNTQTKVVLTNSIYKERLNALDINAVSVEVLDSPDFLEYIQGDYSSVNFKTNEDVNNLIYVLFTSGTTGKPKGVMIEHHSYVNLLYHYKNEYFKECSTVDTFSITNYVFDIWELEYGLPLLTGGTIELAHSDFEELDASKYTFIQMTPSLLSAKLDNIIFNNDELRILVGGEAISLELMNKLFSNHNFGYLLNVYGPTETTIWSTDKKNTHELYDTSIGRPLANTMVYILNEYQQAVPEGVIGELYIGGVGVGRGYLNNPELTRERFLANSFQTEDERVLGINDRIYRTGDLVRYLRDGNIEYMGRNDFQVKIRGFRIELEEIETSLLSYPGVKQAVVWINDQTSDANSKYLIGYYVSDDEFDHASIHNHLMQSLPEYMVPAIFVHLEKLPLTVNGKLDRAELPKPELTSVATYIAPQNETEEKLCQIYAQILALNSSELSVEDDFFRLGGDSILAIKLVSKINKDLGTDIQIPSIFSNRSIRQLANYLMLGNHSTVKITPRKVQKAEDQLLSFAQERLWFIHSYEGGSNAYNMPMVFRLQEAVDIEQLCVAIQAVVERHEVLRSLILESQDGHGYQKVLDRPLQIDKITVSSKEELDLSLAKAVTHIFALDKEYPIQVNIHSLNEQNYVTIVVHHVAFDGWSIDILIKEIFNHYQNSKSQVDSQSVLSPLPIQYKDFALWQREYLVGETFDKQLGYWKNQFADYELLNLPTDKQRPSAIDYSGADIKFDLDALLSKQLRARAKELGVSLYSLLLSGYYLLLSAYSNQNDIVIGTPIANRNYEEISDVIGFFVNTLALRQTIDKQQSITDYIHQVSEAINKAQLYQELPFEKLVETLDIEQDTSRHPIFQVVFGMQKFGNGLDQDIKLLFDEYQDNCISQKTAKFDLTMMLDDSLESISGFFNYATSIFLPQTIGLYIDTYKQILMQLAVPNQKKQLKELKYLDHGQLQVLRRYNTINWQCLEKRNIHQLFEDQVEKTPENMALVYGDKKLTYTQLNERANRLAAYLIDKYRVLPDDLIGLYLDRSENMLIAMLAVLKSGGAYVPMDPSVPNDRISYMISDAQCKVILTNEIYKDRVESLVDLQQVIVETIDTKLFTDCLYKTYSPLNLNVSTQLNHLAYIIYTSGTTGKPKGVMIEHANAANIIRVFSNYFTNIPNKNTREYTNFLWYANYVFDAHIYEVYPPLIGGHSLYLVDGEQRLDLYQLKDYIIDNEIESACIPPILLDKDYLIPLKVLTVVGEVTNQEIIDSYVNNGVKVINGYGPTETTVCSTLHLFSAGDKNTTLGRSVLNYTMYILDPNDQVLPQGAIGELYIGGSGVGRGYLNNPDLTTERFIANPFQTEEEKQLGVNERIYKTGDLVKYLHSGALEYMGRNDSQVKIRGLRIELGEIEVRLSSYPGVKQVVVLPKDHVSGMKYLAAYYIADNLIDSDKLITYASQALPDYMIPSVFVYMDKMPMTVNGKLDRKALPDPDITEARTHVAAQNDMEEQLCQIYSEILNLEASLISVEDDFFKLGGNSIIAIKLVNKVNRTLNKNVRIASIFTYKTIRHLAQHLLEAQEAVEIKSMPVTVPEDQLLSFAQERLWFIQSYEGASSAYNIPIVFQIKENINIESFLSAIKTVVRRHEILRSLIKTSSDGHGYQVVMDDSVNPMHIERIKVLSVKERDAMIHKAMNHNFKLDREYPIQVKLYTLAESNYMSITVHHIAFDGWSVDVLIREVLNYYHYNELIRNNLSHEASRYLLPDLSIQYKDFALWQREYLTGDTLVKQLGYWRDKLSGYEMLTLPIDRPRPVQVDYNGSDVRFELDPALSNNLREVAKNIGVSLYSLLLSAYYLMLGTYSSQKDIVVGAPIANRNYKELANMIGFFVNSLALRQHLDKQQIITDFIKQVGQSVEEAQLYQDLPFERLVNELGIAKDTSKNPIFQVMFVLETLRKEQYNDTLEILDLDSSGSTIAKFDLTAMLDDSDESIKGLFNYATSLFNKATIESYVSTYKLILEQLSELNVPENLLKTVSDINYIDISQNILLMNSSANEEDDDMWSNYEIK